MLRWTKARGCAEFWDTTRSTEHCIFRGVVSRHAFMLRHLYGSWSYINPTMMSSQTILEAQKRQASYERNSIIRYFTGADGITCMSVKSHHALKYDFIHGAYVGEWFWT